jgi:hypothetical protein
MIYPRKIITVDADVAHDVEQLAAAHGKTARDVASALLRAGLEAADDAFVQNVKPTPRGRPKGTMGKLRRMSE